MSNEKFPKVALGAWAWGNDGTFGAGIPASELRPIFDTAMESGLNLWDTAYAYGMGTSEKVLGSFLEGLPRDSYYVSDKFTPQCANPASGDPVGEMYDMQLEMLGIEGVDIYWIHNASEAPRWTKAVAEYFEGREDAPIIGVSNHNLEEIKEADAILREHGLRLGAVQNHYSLINRSSEDSGILDWCRENGAVFFSYMVLEQGALTGTYTPEHPMPEGSDRARVYNPLLGKLEALNGKMAEIAKAHGVDTAQIPVAWAIAKRTLPIVGVTKKHHVSDAVAAANVVLSQGEIDELEGLAASLRLNTIRPWEKLMD